MGITIREVITRADDIRNNKIADSIKIEWLSQLDEQIYEDVILRHEDHEEYEDVSFPYAADTQVLLAPRRWKDMYVKYLMAKIDYYQTEMGAFGNDNQAHISACADFVNWYNSNHLPLENHRFTVKPQYMRSTTDVFDR